MRAGKNGGLVDAAILAFRSAGRGLGCAAGGLAAALHCGAVILDCGMAV